MGHVAVYITTDLENREATEVKRCMKLKEISNLSAYFEQNCHETAKLQDPKVANSGMESSYLSHSSYFGIKLFATFNQKSVAVSQLEI